MDKGAHFFKCDFQVHTPRDINWTGRKFGFNPDQIPTLAEDEIVELNDERIQFAHEYLQKIRQAGLNAVAITDHHDMVFAKIIRKVAEEENVIFKQQGENNKIVTVFPGVELTLANPICQCILIFDSDFLDSNLDSILSILGITQSNKFEKLTIPTTRISTEHIADLKHLHKKLDEISYCVGKYILLPNVTDGGTSTLLRSGAQEHYKKMPCVGGYVDKGLSTGTGWLNKLNGGRSQFWKQSNRIN